MSLFLGYLRTFFVGVMCVSSVAFRSHVAKWLPVPKILGSLCRFFLHHLCTFFVFSFIY